MNRSSRFGTGGSVRVRFVVSLVSIILFVLAEQQALAQAEPARTIVLYGAGSSAAHLAEYGKPLNVDFTAFEDDTIEALDTSKIDGDLVILLGGSRGRGRGRGGGRGGRGGGEDAETQRRNEAFDAFFLKLHDEQPEVKLVAASQMYRALERRGSPLIEQQLIEPDDRLGDYLGAERSSQENLRRLATFLAVTYAGRDAEIEDPATLQVHGFYHPALKKFVPTLEEFLEWAAQQGSDVEEAARVVVLANHTHFVARNREGIDSILRELTERGAIAACMIVELPENRTLIERFQPHVAIDAFHRGDDIEFRKQLGIPHLQAIWLARQTVSEWEQTVSHVGSYLGIVSGEANGAIEPHVVAALSDDRAFESFVPIADRVDRIVSRSLAWAGLAQMPNAKKRVAMLVAGAPGGDLDNGASMLAVLDRLQAEGYDIGHIPYDSRELHVLIEEYCSQISPAEPEELEALTRSGKAALIPLERYLQWFKEKVPPEQRKAVEDVWGAAPGKVMSWTDDQGQAFLVVPRMDLGNVSLVAKPFPVGKADEFEDYNKRKHERGNPPGHNVLATYFWLEEEYHADAVIVWGNLSIDLLLPGKAVGLTSHDWPDILWGAMPNIRPFSLGSLTFAIPAKRRTKAVLIDYLTPPRIPGELDDDLLDIQSNLVKWNATREGALRERFREILTQQFRDLKLGIDLHIDLAESQRLDDDQLNQLAAYFNELDAERITVNRHILGSPIPEHLEVPYLVTCLGTRFLTELGETLEVPESDSVLPGDRKKYLRGKAAEAVALVVQERFTPEEAFESIGGDTEAMNEEVREGFDLVAQLHDGFQHATDELDNLMASLEGRFVSPGPSSPPERNPSSVPTGRNMYVMNPEEIPSRASWEVGRDLVDAMLAEKYESDGKYPDKVAYVLSTRGTMSDFGVSEAEILYTLGVEPVYSGGDRVVDVKPISLEDLGRPRIDVFIEPKHYYAEYLESRLRLIDKAIRMVAELDEPDNAIAAHREEVRQNLLDQGMAPEKAEALASARIFAVAPERFGSGLHDHLFEETGIWDNEQQLVDIYIAQHNFVYTDGLWGEESAEGFIQQIDGTDIVMRSLNRRGALAGRAHYSGGMLSLVTKVISGTEPEYYLSDLRNPGEERVLAAHDALRRDVRSQLFNRKWIESMMQQGPGGGVAMASRVWHLLGFKINQSKSVDDDVWEEIVKVYLRDSKDLSLDKWFDRTNPAAFQALTATLLESIRKGYWKPRREVLMEVAQAHVRSVIRHGPADDLDNEKLEAFVKDTLNAPGTEQLAELVAEYSQSTISDAADGAQAAVTSEERPEESTEEQKPSEDVAATEVVEGPTLEPITDSQPVATGHSQMLWLAGIAVIVLFTAGFWKRTGAA